MNKFFIILLFCFFCLFVKAQNSVPAEQPYGKIALEDLQMTSCDFEKDANAEVLFDVAKIYPETEIGINNMRELSLVMERHIRIKIYNEFGKNSSNIRMINPSFNDLPPIKDLEAETINLENGKITYTPVDKKNFYSEKADKIFSLLSFTFPAVRPGSVIEYKYSLALQSFPKWYFQSSLPTRYSEYQVDFPNELNFKAIPHVTLPYVKNVGESEDLRQIKALANIHSLPDELYTGAQKDNLERIEYFGKTGLSITWDRIGENVIKFDDFGSEFGRSIAGESDIIKQAKSFKTNDEKIAFIFDTVKNSMKWSERTEFYVIDGTTVAWDKKAGNSAEINLIVYNLLRRTGVKAYPMMVSTKKNGKINPANPDIFQLNNTVVYVPVDSTKYYVLDATDKSNLYNTIPTDYLNSFGLKIDKGDKEYKLVFLEDTDPVIQSIVLNAEIKPDAKIEGNAVITSFGYNKTTAIKNYIMNGEHHYVDFLKNNDNSLKISSFKMENAGIDSLPLTQKINFIRDLTGSDENYIYINANEFKLMGENPFTKEQRFTDIDLGYNANYSIVSVYKLPSGFKIDAQPKSITIVVPDGSIIFKRIVAADGDTLFVKYILIHKKTIYFKENYQDIRGFYKKMYELLNEQIVLKKSS